MVNSFLPVEENIFKISTYTGWLKPQWKSNPITAWAQSMPSFLATRWMPLTIKQKSDDKNYFPSHIVEEAMTWYSRKLCFHGVRPHFSSLLPLVFYSPSLTSPPPLSLLSLLTPFAFFAFLPQSSGSLFPPSHRCPIPSLTHEWKVFQEITREGRGGGGGGNLPWNMCHSNRKVTSHTTVSYSSTPTPTLLLQIR